MGKRLGLIGLSVGLALMPATARAEQEDPVRWLRKQPLTLFDLGMMRLERDVLAASRWIRDAEILDDAPTAGLEYAWRTNRITAFVSFGYPPRRRTAAECRRLFGRIVGKITGAAPGGPGRASWYLQSTFLPVGRGWSRPSPKFAQQLTKRVRLQVVLRGTAEEGMTLAAKKVNCIGRLDAENAEIELEFTH